MLLWHWCWQAWAQFASNHKQSYRRWFARCDIHGRSSSLCSTHVLPFPEEAKDGKMNTPKHKSKTVCLTKRPHVVVMMNEFPQKNLKEKVHQRIAAHVLWLMTMVKMQSGSKVLSVIHPVLINQQLMRLSNPQFSPDFQTICKTTSIRCLNPAFVRQNKKQVQKPSAKLSPMQFKRGQNLPSNTCV